LKWYSANKRDLPWRRTGDPYAIWISEIMLQQTQVETVIPYFNNWMRRFPDIKKLAQADENEVIKMWEGLGYYTRVRNLHRASKEIVSKFSGKIPQTREEILSLPGIGKYTAGAILSIAFNMQEPLVDGNVIRVLARLFNIHSDSSSPATLKKIWGLASALVPEKSPGDFNQALMELGATVCTPANPGCLICPLSCECLSLKKSDPSKLPILKSKIETQKFEGWIFLVENKGRFLIQKRPEGQVMGGLWEFPSLMDGHWDHPEKLIWKELKIRGEIHGILGKVNAAFTKFRGNYKVAHLKTTAAPVRKNSKWVKRDRFGEFTFCAPARKTMSLIMQNEK